MSLRSAGLRTAIAGVALLALAAQAADAPRKVAAVEGVAEYRLENGLRVLTVPVAADDQVTVHITYLVGSRHEGYGEKGLAHLLEHLLFKGSTHHPQIKEQLTQRGARWNGTTSYDRTNYYETLPAGEENLDWALRMEADRMVNSFISRSDLDSEMTVVRNEFEMGQNSPSGVLLQRMQRLAYAWHNYGNPTIGTRSDIERVPVERLQAFYRTWYRPDNAILVVAGRFDEARALERVTKHFGAIARPAQAVPPIYTDEPTQDGERSVTLRRAGETQLVAALYRVPAASHPDYPALDVLVDILGRTPSGRLHKALVQSGLASSVSAAERGLHDPGFVYFSAGLSKSGSLDPARDALLHTLERTGDDPLREDEVARAKTSLLNEFDGMRIETTALVEALSEFSALGDWRLLFLYRDRLKATTADDVRRVARAYLKADNRVLGMFVPTPQADRAEIPATPDLERALAGYRGGEPVEAGEAFDASPANIEARVVRKTLANGIRIALLPKKTRGGRIVADLALHWGDPQSMSGRLTACSMAGAMLMRGTARRTRAELRDALDQLNATLSAGIFGASIEARGERFAQALRLAAEVLREPAFPRSEFEELKRASLTGIEAHRSDPGTLAAVELGRHLRPYPKGHPLYTDTPDEQLRNTKEATLDAAKSCYQDLLGATGADFAAVGDFDAQALAQQIEQLFGDWKSPRPFVRVAARHFERAALIRQLRTPDKANAALRAGLSIPLRDDHPDYAALVLANYLLGGASTSRIPARVREQEGLSYSTYTWLEASAFDPVASFGVAAIYAPQNRERITRAIREEIERARREGFGAQEVAAAKSGLLKGRQIARADDRVLAGRLTSYLFRQRTFAWDEALEKRIAALTPHEVGAALRRHIDPAKLSVVTAGDFK